MIVTVESERAAAASGEPPAAGPIRFPRLPGSALRWVRLIALLVVLLLGMLVIRQTLFDPERPSLHELREQAGLIGKRELLIGVKDDQPGVGWYENGIYTGFDIDIALMVAADLGFAADRVRFLSIESEDRAKRQARTPEGRFATVDLVIASYSITRQREESGAVTFSAPYLSTEQSVLTRVDHPELETLEDLRGQKVCTMSTATSESPAEDAGVVLIKKKRIGDCVVALDRGEVVAVTTDAAILAGFAAQQPGRFTLHDIGLDGVELWGINTGGNTALRDLVNLILRESLTNPRDQRWEQAFRKNLQPLQAFSPDQQVAIDEQPTNIPEVEVRRWPWETIQLPLGMAPTPPRTTSARRR
jgi:glutamate transport system substrate-binding protein